MKLENLKYTLVNRWGFTHSWSRTLIVQLLKNFPAFYGTQSFIAVFTRAFHWSLFWAIPCHPISLRSNLILFTHLRLDRPSGLFPLLSHQYPIFIGSGIATGYGLHEEGGSGSSESRWGQKNFHFFISSRPALGSTQPVKWVQGCEADHSPPTSAEVKKMWICISTPPIRLHGVMLN
jgi:hypothetical protein